MRMKYWMLALASTFLLSFQAVAQNVAKVGNTEATSLPKATVTRLDAMTLMAGNYSIYNGSLSTASENLRLQAVVNFKAEETVEQAQAGGYGDYACDFYLSFSGLKNGSIDGSGCYLAGCYGESGAFSSLGWIAIPTDIFADSTGVFTITENVEYPVLSAYDANLTYENICDYVKDFTAAIYVKPEILEANPDFKVSLALKMREPNTNTLLTVGDAYVFDATTLKKAFLPTATVTTVKNDDLTFALNFKADAATEAQLATYGNWYADFVLKVNKDVTFNANGGANGYLSGQYDAWSENWVNVPFEDVTLKANESLKIMEYAAEMMNQSGLKLTYNDVYSFVKDFDCGVFFEPAFLAANPDLNVTLELRMYNPANEDESYVIGKTYEFKVGEKPTVVIPETITPPEGIEGNTTVETTVVVLPTEVKTFEISLKTVETESSVTSKVVFTVEPKNETGDKVSEPTSAITFRLPVPATWAGFAKVSHDGKAMGVYEIKEANGDKYVEVSSAKFSEFAVELAAVELPGEDDKVASEAFGTNTVFDGTNYYATLQTAVEAVCGTNGATLYCKPGADVGSLQHAPVTATLTIYGNGAYVSGGSERDFDIGNTDPSGGKDITADMTLTVKDLEGCGAWGAKATDHTVNLIFEDCQNMGKVFITGTMGTLNITIKDSAFEGVIKEAVYSNADGAITLTNVDFSNLNKAVNLNHKAAGTQTVTITDCSFTACGADVANDQIPVRVLSSVEGGKSELTVSGTTFTGTPEGGADILLDYGVGETTANISTAATVANVVVEKTENVGTTTTIPANTQNQSFATVEPVAKIGGTTYATFAEALTAAKAMTGDVTVEIYEKVTLNTSLSGSYSSITFVGKDTDAEIYLEVQGYITATGKTVNFQDLKLSKSQGGFITNAGFMNTAFGVYDVKAVNYTNCTFSNGAYASSGTVTFTKCIFKRSWDKYGLWAYGDVNCIVDECTFDDYRGIKMYAEGAAKTTDLTVKNSDFSAVTDKPAIVLTYGESVNLEDNTYSSTGTFELDLDGAPNGVAVTSDVTPTCKNDNGACGVLVDGKIYTTVAQAAAVATSGSTVTLLHDATETVELPEGVTLNKNGFTADGVTVAQPVAQIGETTYATLQAAIDAVQNNETITVLRDVKVEEAQATNNNAVYYVGDKSFVLDLNGKTITGNTSNVVLRFQKANGIENTITIKNGKIVSKENSWSAISVGSNADTKTNINLTGLEIEACKRNDFAVRARSGAIFTITDCTITAKAYGGGVAAGGGEVTMTNVTINQYGLDASAPWNSAAFGISGGGKITINSGSYYATPLAANDGNNQGTSHGSFTGIIMNSGGTLIINDGTFTNDNFGDNALATAARGVIEADTGAVVEINGGSFNALKSVLAMTNNLGDSTKNPSATLKGGTFSADPRVSGLYASDLIKVAEGYLVVENNGVWSVAKAVAQIGEQTYTTIADAVAALKANGGTLKLLADVNESMTFNNPAENAPTEITVDLNGFTVTSAESTLWVSDGYIVTVKDSSDAKTGKIISTNTEGEAIAITRNGHVILESGYIYNDFCAVWLYNATENGSFVMNGGTLEVPDGGQTLSVGAGKATINGGKILCNKVPNGGGWNTLVYQDGALEISGGEFFGTIGSYGGPISISGGTFSYPDDPNDGFREAHLASGYATKVNADGSITVYKLPTSLQGTGTAEDPFLINNIDDLKLFRNLVNSGTRYNGQYVKLTANIDLNDEEWTPIGDRNVDQGSFLGTFDGDNHTISNLWISEWTKTGAGFFSKVGLQTEYVSGTVRNLTFNNVTIVSSESYVGVIAQAPSGALIENVHVTGDITISGYGYVGGIVGHGYPTINNSSVVGNTGSTITANYWGAGAILGFSGDSGAKISNATVEGVKIHANSGGAASVTGSPYGAVLDGASVKNVEITSNSDYCMGYVSAGGNLSNVTIENVTATANGQPITPADAKASIDDTVYFSLSSALDAATDGQTITLLADVTCTEKPVFSKGGIVNVDVNGHVFVSTEQARVRNVVSADGKVPSNNIKFVSGFGWEVYQYNGMPATNVEFRVFPTLEAAVTYNPSTNNPARIYPYQNVTQEADVTLKAYPAGTSSTICVDPGYEIVWDLNGYAVTQESPTGNPLEACVRGKFTLKDSSAEQTGKWIAGACGVKDPSDRFYGGGGPAFYLLGEGELILKGGTVSIARNATPDMEGNEIINTGGLIYLEDGKLTVDGATLQVDDAYGIVIWGGEAVIQSGTFDLAPSESWALFASASAKVTINSPVTGAILVVSGADVTVNVSGVAYYEGPGYVAPAVGEGLMTFNGLVLEEGVAVVTNATSVTPYATLQAAIDAAVDGDTIELLADIEATEVILLDKNLTINGNGKTITSSANRVIRIAADVTINNLNMVSTAVRVGTNDIRGVSVDYYTANDDFDLVLNNCSVDFTDASANDWAYAVNQSGDDSSGNTITIIGGTYEGANVINVRGANHTVTVQNATLNCTYPQNSLYEGACVWVMEQKGSSVEATGNTFNGSNAVAFNLGTGTELTESNNTDNTAIWGVAKIGDQKYASLEAALAAAQASQTITLLADLSSSEIIVLDKAITLDGNGKKLTSTAGRAINVSGADGVTIKNLTIDAKGERAINIIQNATNVTIDNVTATAANYTVNVASSAPEAVVTITNSNLTGLNVVNVAAEGAEVTITSGTITCNDQNSKENYAALALNKDAKNGTITATNVTFDIKDDSKKASNGAEGGTITIDGSTAEVSIVVAYISYGDNYYSFTSLQDAIDHAQAGQEVTLLVPPTADANNVVTASTAGATLEAAKAYEVAKLLGGEFKKTTEGTLQYAYEFGVSYITYDPTNAEKPIVLVAKLEEGEDAAANRNLTGRFLVVTVTQKSNGASTKYMVQDPVLDADGKITVNLPLVDDQSGQGVLFSVSVTDETPDSATVL